MLDLKSRALLQTTLELIDQNWQCRIIIAPCFSSGVVPASDWLALRPVYSSVVHVHTYVPVPRARLHPGEGPAKLVV
jgi:hypothetical protein